MMLRCVLMLLVYNILLCTMKSLFILKYKVDLHFEPHMNDVYVDAFIDQTFNQNGIESLILEIKY